MTAPTVTTDTQSAGAILRAAEAVASILMASPPEERAAIIARLDDAEILAVDRALVAVGRRLDDARKPFLRLDGQVKVRLSRDDLARLTVIDRDRRLNMDILTEEIRDRYNAAVGRRSALRRRDNAREQVRTSIREIAEKLRTRAVQYDQMASRLERLDDGPTEDADGAYIATVTELMNDFSWMAPNLHLSDLVRHAITADTAPEGSN